MQPICVNPDELIEVVYLPEVKDEDFVRRMLEDLPGKIAEGLRGSPSPPIQESSTPQHKLTWWLGVVVSVFVIIGGLWAGLHFVISSELRAAFEQPNKDFASLRDKDVGGMQKDIQYLRRDVDKILDRSATDTLSGGSKRASTANLNPADIKEAAQRGRTRNLPISVDSLTRNGQSVFDAGVRVPSTPEVWGALSELINYRTQLEKGADVIGLLREGKIKSCSSFPPTVFGHGVKGKDGAVAYTQQGPFGWQNCYLKLDDPALPAVMRDKIQCGNCIVEYAGGTLQVQRAELHDCFFIFHLEAKPSERGLQLVQGIIKNPNTVALG
jgi:hypothetical protein